MKSARLLRRALQPRQLLQVRARGLELRVDRLLRRHDSVLVQWRDGNLDGFAKEVRRCVAGAKGLADAVRRGGRRRVGAAGGVVALCAGTYGAATHSAMYRDVQSSMLP